FYRQLFNAFFIEDKDFSEMSVLKQLAWNAGLNPNELEKVLIEHQMVEEVEEDLLIGQTYRITTVPSVVIADHVLSGIQEESVLIKAIELAGTGELKAETRKLPHLPISISRS
ncbi:MAG: DsbA family protein, partial [Blastocatellia bacterium]